MKNIKLQTRNVRTRWREISALSLVLAVSACDEPPTPQELSDAKIFLDAIEKNKEFSKKERNDEKAEIDLSYLDDKFPGMDICYHHGYGVGRGIRRKIKGKKEIYINKFEEDNNLESKYIFFITNKVSYIFHPNKDDIYSLSAFNTKIENGELHVSYQCIKARDVQISLEAGYYSKLLQGAK